MNSPETEGVEDFKGRLPSQLERLAQFVRERSMARSFAVYASLSVVLALVLAIEVLLAYRALEIQSFAPRTTSASAGHAVFAGMSGNTWQVDS